MNFDSIIAQVDSLSPLSDAAIFVQRLYADGAQNVEIIKLVKIIESDALLDAEYFKHVALRIKNSYLENLINKVDDDF